jgi:hypothetical protein
LPAPAAIFVQGPVPHHDSGSSSIVPATGIDLVAEHPVELLIGGHEPHANAARELNGAAGEVHAQAVVISECQAFPNEQDVGNVASQAKRVGVGRVR